MKKGDKVSLAGRAEVTGTIIDTRLQHLWGIDYTEYLVKYDQKDLIPAQDWHDEFHLVLLPSLPSGAVNRVKCECGASSVMSNARHSDYCPLYRK